MGGIPASATNFGLKRDSNLFSNSQDFTLFLVSEADYVANKGSLTRLANTPFARLYAYYNTNAQNNIVYEISSVMGGSATITLNNNTGYNVELRKDGIYGETIGYAGASTINTTFHVDYGDYYIYPVFRKFDATLNEIVTVYPKYTSGNANGRARVEILSLTTENPAANLNAARWKEGVTFTSGYAYIRINNQSSVGLQMFDGANSTPLQTSTGVTIVNSGRSFTYALPMDLDRSNSSTGQYAYATSKQYSQLRVGSALEDAYYLTGNSTTMKTFEAGKIYTYTVTGETPYDIKVDTNPTESEMPSF